MVPGWSFAGMCAFFIACVKYTVFPNYNVVYCKTAFHLQYSVISFSLFHRKVQFVGASGLYYLFCSVTGTQSGVKNHTNYASRRNATGLIKAIHTPNMLTPMIMFRMNHNR